MQESKETPPVLLMIDDDEEDIYLTQRAFSTQQRNLIFRSAQTNNELFDYLHNRNCFSDETQNLPPDVILLDINIPKTNGYDILRNIRCDEKFGHIPVVMLTTSEADYDIRKAYALGANSYICKSANAAGMKRIADLFCQYWFAFNQLPRAE